MAIVIVGLIVASAVLFKNDNPRVINLNDSTQTITDPTIKIRPVTASDHWQGRLGAPVTVIEYSDLECPFCKRFHNTMKEALAFYNGNEEVKLTWVYRHFPLDSLHSKARKEAEATECAATLGGNDQFWAYTDKIFTVTPSNDGLDPSLLPLLAAEIGLDRQAFEACLAGGQQAGKVQADYDEAIAAGGQGTPFVIVIGSDNKQITLPGAVPLDQVKKAVDELLK